MPHDPTKYMKFNYRNWLTIRENTIMVKGKGEMQTYWCDPMNNRRSIASDVESTNPSHTNGDSGHGNTDPILFDVWYAIWYVASKIINCLLGLSFYHNSLLFGWFCRLLCRSLDSLCIRHTGCCAIGHDYLRCCLFLLWVGTAHSIDVV